MESTLAFPGFMPKTLTPGVSKLGLMHMCQIQGQQLQGG